MKNFVLLSSLFLMTLISACTSAPTPTQSDSPLLQTPIQNAASGHASEGQTLFLAHCVSCHAGPGNKPNATILDSTRLQSVNDFKALLRQPTSSMMRAFSPEELNDEAVSKLYAYLVTAKTPSLKP